MSDQEDRRQEAIMDELIESGRACCTCGRETKRPYPYPGGSRQCEDCEDPTPDESFIPGTV